QAAPGHNERLEFLGDAVIGQVVSRLLYDRFPEEDEGLLTARRAALVNRESLAAIALQLGLDRYVMLGRGEAGAGGAARPSLLADGRSMGTGHGSSRQRAEEDAAAATLSQLADRSPPAGDAL